MAREVFKQKLLEYAKRKARDSNYQFTRDVEINLRELINTGVDRMKLAEYGSLEKRRLVKHNLDILVDHMINNAKSRRMSDSLDTRAFSSVRLSICPLWPFC